MSKPSSWQVSDSDLRQYFNDIQRAYHWECNQHRRRWDRYHALPISVRESPKFSAQIHEDLSELRQAPGKYEDTMFGQIMAVLAGVMGSDGATYEEVVVVEDFVGRLRSQNQRLEKAVRKLETYSEKLRCD
ncbi:hypothetical protein AC578_10530 [Pseudocercospora eumusae]|uniref:Uncharacterized protein n=1 Tax=Pseudocercospora eumusae TaxID=321146 RepID=A0A139H621_9PEZI|nr:hypothetical protein AC578_10530 [Pseudocercospora eumusae]